VKTATLFPHLEPDATWTQRQDAGDRMRAIYTKDAAKVQAAEIGEKKVHIGYAKVMMGTNGKCYTIGLDYAMVMGRSFITYRALAKKNRHRDDRAHYVKNALRLRRALCRYGLE
jgi:hypothetical protein